MTAMAVTIFSWPSVCFDDELPNRDKIEPIDAQEYSSAQQDMLRYNIFPKKATVDSTILNEFLSKVIVFDKDVRDIFSMNPDYYDLFEMSSEGMTIYMLEFEIYGVWKFCYLATKTADGALSVSDVKIDSSPIVMSKDGYIAGFSEVGDGYWTQPTIYTFSLDETTGELSITKLGTFINADGDFWRIHYCYCPGLTFEFASLHPVFWRTGTLYMEGLQMPIEVDGIWQADSVSYYKLVVDESDN